MYGRRVSVSAQLKQLPPPSTNVNDSIGWISDDVILMSLSLSAILQRNMQSISTPLLFQSMHLNCVPKVEASLGFFHSSRVFIPSLDPDGTAELHAPSPSRTSQKSSSRGPDHNSAKIDSVLQHPHVQHKSTLSLRSLDILEWLELAEQQLEAACSFETAEIPHLILLKKDGQQQRRPHRRHRWSAKDQWQIQLKSGFQSNARSNISLDDVSFLEALMMSKKIDLNDETTEERASFDPLQLLLKQLSKDNKDAFEARVREDRVTLWNFK